MISLIWAFLVWLSLTYALFDLCYEPLAFEPLIFGLWLWLFDDLDIWLWYDMPFEPFSLIPEPSSFPSHEGNMAVPLMHQWHDSRVGEWFLTPSPFIWYARFMVIMMIVIICSGGVWIAILGSLCVRWIWHDYDYDYYMFGECAWVQSVSSHFGS